MGSLKSPCTTSYTIETTALNCLVFEKIAFFCILATGRQTDEQMDSIDPLSRFRCRERRLNNISPCLYVWLFFCPSATCLPSTYVTWLGVRFTKAGSSGLAWTWCWSLAVFHPHGVKQSRRANSADQLLPRLVEMAGIVLMACVCLFVCSQHHMRTVRASS